SEFRLVVFHYVKHPPPNDSAEYWQNARSLIPETIDLAAAVEGQWRIENGALSAAAEARCSRYQLDYQPPAEYDMLLEFTRTEGKRGVIQILAAEGRQFIWRMDVDGISGLDKIGGAYFYDSPATLHTA